MNKPPDDPTKHGDVVPVDAPQLPATKKPTDKFRLYKRLEEDADEILEEFNRLENLERRIRHREPGETLPPICNVELYEDFVRKFARCRERWALLDPKEYYDQPHDDDDDDDGDRPLLKKKIISKRLGMMLTAVCIGEAKMQQGFEHMLLEHVYIAEFSYLALEGGCRELEMSKALSPVVAVVLEVMERHRRLWWDRKRALTMIERTSAELVDQIQKLKPQFAIEQAQAKVTEARIRWHERLALLQHVSNNAIDAQNAAREAHLKVERGMARLASCQRGVDDAAAVLKQATDALEALKEQQTAPVS